MTELEAFNVGDVIDIMIEQANDSYQYKQIATQADFDMF